MWCLIVSIPDFCPLSYFAFPFPRSNIYVCSFVPLSIPSRVHVALPRGAMGLSAVCDCGIS